MPINGFRMIGTDCLPTDAGKADGLPTERSNDPSVRKPLCGKALSDLPTDTTDYLPIPDISRARARTRWPLTGTSVVSVGIRR